MLEQHLLMPRAESFALASASTVRSSSRLRDRADPRLAECGPDQPQQAVRDQC